MPLNRKRKAPLVQWLILYHGVGNSHIVGDFRACWNTQQAAANAVIRYGNDLENYEVVKFERAY